MQNNSEIQVVWLIVLVLRMRFNCINICEFGSQVDNHELWSLGESDATDESDAIAAWFYEFHFQKKTRHFWSAVKIAGRSFQLCIKETGSFWRSLLRTVDSLQCTLTSSDRSALPTKLAMSSNTEQIISEFAEASKGLSVLRLLVVNSIKRFIVSGIFCSREQFLILSSTYLELDVWTNKETEFKKKWVLLNDLRKMTSKNGKF